MATRTVPIYMVRANSPWRRKTSASQCPITVIKAVQYRKPETDGKNRLRMSCFSQTQFAQPSTLGPRGHYWRMEAGKLVSSLRKKKTESEFGQMEKRPQKNGENELSFDVKTLNRPWQRGSYANDGISYSYFRVQSFINVMEANCSQHAQARHVFLAVCC